MHLKCKDLTRFRRKHRLQKCPNGQVITILARSLKTRISLKRAKGGPIEIFFYSAKTREDLGAKRSSKSARIAKLWKFWQGHPKPGFYKKRAKGGPREIFQKSPKKKASLKILKSTLAQITLSSI